MKREEYEKRLNDAYKKHFCSGQCAHFSECKKGQIDDGLFFNRAKLGKHYGNGKYRKVLVVGKEAVTENPKITQTVSLEEADNPHYLRTLYTLATILKEEPNGYSYSDLKKYEELLDYFCLTNYFKCSFTETETEKDVKKAKKRAGVKVSKEMKKECWHILMNEINALKPEIIIIQGTSYSNKFWKKIKECYGKNSLRKSEYKKDYEQLTKHKYKNGDPLYIVWAYHPTARSPHAWNQQLDNLLDILEKLKGLLDEEIAKHK